MRTPIGDEERTKRIQALGGLVSDQAVIDELIQRFDARTLQAGVRMAKGAKNARDPGALLVSMLRRGTVQSRMALEDARQKAEAEARQREASRRLDEARAAMAEAERLQAERNQALRVIEAASIEALREAVESVLARDATLPRALSHLRLSLDQPHDLRKLAMHQLLRHDVVALLNQENQHGT